MCFQDAIIGLSIFRVTATDPDSGVSGLINFNITVSFSSVNDQDVSITIHLQ